MRGLLTRRRFAELYAWRALPPAEFSYAWACHLIEWLPPSRESRRAAAIAREEQLRPQVGAERAAELRRFFIARRRLYPIRLEVRA